jgi:hypothetical protein
MDASDSEVRAWARETGWAGANGRGVSERGNLPQAAREAYSAAHNGGPRPGPAYPPGMTDADFETAEASGPAAPEDMDEVIPRAVSPKPSPRMTAKNLAGRFRPGTGKGKPKPRARPRHPRISTAELIGSAWRIAAKVAQPLPPMYRTLRLQSVIAGPLLDDAVKGTMVDPVLQPLARLSRAGETVSALIAPNLAIGAMAYHLHQTSGEPNPIVMQACQEMLRHGLMAMMRVGGDAFAEQMAKDREDEERFGGDIDTIMMFILADLADPATEEENITRMAAAFAGQPDPEPAAA